LMKFESMDTYILDQTGCRSISVQLQTLSNGHEHENEFS
jgi:hypothetical protein